MTGYDVTIPACVAAWIEANMPELGGLRGVRVRCCRALPFQWLPGFMPGVVGITLWDTIYLKGASCTIDPASLESMELLFHELVHVGQFRRGRLTFPIRYLIALARVGYWRIPAEQEARERAAELVARYRFEGPCAS